MRSSLDDDERAAIAGVVGHLSDELALPIRNARGLTFQRLEFLGDSVLDVILQVHAVIEPGCPECAEVGDVGTLVTDHRLALRARGIGLGSWLEWDASAERLADLVEACAAAAWLAGGWSQAGDFAGKAVHPPVSRCVAALEGKEVTASTGDRRERRLGAAVLELAAATLVFNDRPDADEGQLSQLRAVAHRTSRVAAHARRSRVVPAVGEDAVVSDRVEAWLAETLLTRGADAALADAAEVLG